MINSVIVQDEESKQKKKLRRVMLGTSADDLTNWLEGIPQLKKYSTKLASVTGARICTLVSEEDLVALGIVARGL